VEKNFKEMLQDFVDLYHHQTQKGRNRAVDFDLQPDGGTWHVIFGGEEVPEVEQGPHVGARFTFVLSPDTLVQLYQGDLSPLTAAGREHISKPAPLDFRLGEAVELTPDVYREMILFMQRFFNRSSPEKIIFGEEHTRKVHGGHAAAMFYDQGFRSAWYLLKEGERLNEPGDRNPFPQAFVFLSGKGRARIGKDMVNVQAGEAYYIPPQSEHIVWNEREEPLTLFFLAWGEGA